MTSAICLMAVVACVTLQGCALHRGDRALASLPDSAYGDERLARELRPAGEFPLYRVGADSGKVVYRMVSLGAWGGAVIMRLEQHGDAWVFVQKQTDNEERRRLREADSATVSRAAADRFVAVMREANFWTRPVQQCRLGLDGYRVVLEARIGADYHTINCWVPEESGAPAVVASMRAFTELAEKSFRSPAGR